MKNQFAIFLVILAASFVVTPVAGHPSCLRKKVERTGSCNSGYANAALINGPGVDSLLVGGQNGTWFESGQSPRLYAVYLQNDSAAQLSPVRSEGTVWGGGFNGSQFLISGWGTDEASEGPYIFLYDRTNVVAEGSLDYYGEASSWSGGDVFAASYNGKEWLLSGLGSGPLSSYSADATNHMSLGTFNGTVFTDLSNLVPKQHDAILYANAWNGLYWLIGGATLVMVQYSLSTEVELLTSPRKLNRLSLALHQFSPSNGMGNTG